MIAVVLLVSINSALAQETALRGEVVDAGTAEPLAGVNVFIDQTTKGSATARDGSYEIGSVPPGEYRVVASMIGYGTLVKTIEVVPQQASYRLDFGLSPTVIQLDSVAVEADRPRGWERNLRLFERHFVGFSDNARATEILNPHVLDFTNDGDLFRASASVPLIVENRAMGYRLTVYMRRYTGSAALLQMQGPIRFEEMEPSSRDEARRWEERRRETYEGSLTHFLRSLVGGTLPEEDFFARHELHLGYNIHRVEVGAFPILEETDRPYLYRLFFEHDMFVARGREESRMRLTGEEALVHEAGYVYGLQSAGPPLIVSGDMSIDRLADFLPRDYGL